MRRLVTISAAPAHGHWHPRTHCTAYMHTSAPKCITHRRERQRKRETERGKEIERDRERERDRETHTQTHTHTHTHTRTHTHTHTHTHTDTQTHRNRRDFAVPGLVAISAAPANGHWHTHELGPSAHSYGAEKTIHVYVQNDPLARQLQWGWHGRWWG